MAKKEKLKISVHFEYADGTRYHGEFRDGAKTGKKSSFL